MNHIIDEKVKRARRERERPGCDEHAKHEGEDRENGNPFCRDFGRGTTLHLLGKVVLHSDWEMKKTRSLI